MTEPCPMCGRSDPEPELIEIPEDLKPIEPLINQWLQYKKERRQAYRPTGLRMLWKMIRDIPVDKRVKSIEMSMAKNYAGIYEVSDFNKSTVGMAKPKEGQYKGLEE